MKAFYKGQTKTIKFKGKRIGFYLHKAWENPQQIGNKLKITQAYNAIKTGNALSLE